MHNKLTTSYTLSLTENNIEVPTEFRIFNFGTVSTTKGDFLFTKENAKTIVEEVLKWGNKLSIDYDHSAVSAELDPKPASGWFDLEIKADGLYAVAVEWTNRALEFLKNREYRYYSPTFYVNETNNIISLLNVALTNIPATHNLKPLVANKLTEDTSMDITLALSETEVAFFQAMQPDATDLQPLVQKWVSDMVVSENTEEKVEEPVQEAAETPVAEEPKKEEVVKTSRGELAALKLTAEHYEEIKKELVSLKHQVEKTERKEVIEKLKAEGKITPALEAGFLKTCSLQTLKDYAQYAPVILNRKDVATPTVKQTYKGKSIDELVKSSIPELISLASENPELFEQVKLLRNK